MGQGERRRSWPRRTQQSEPRALCTQKRMPTSGAGSLPALGFPHLEEGGSQGRYWALGPPAQHVLMWLTSCNASWSFQPNSHAHLLLFPLLSPGQSQPTVTGYPEFLEYEKTSVGTQDRGHEIYFTYPATSDPAIFPTSSGTRTVTLTPEVRQSPFGDFSNIGI